jgi:hypothetical protein
MDDKNPNHKPQISGALFDLHMVHARQLAELQTTLTAMASQLERIQGELTLLTAQVASKQGPQRH